MTRDWSWTMFISLVPTLEDVFIELTGKKLRD